MKIEKYNRPVLYFAATISATWVLWSVVAVISHSPLWQVQGWVTFASILGILGLAAPMIVAFALILPDKDMRNELKSATFSFKGINWKWFAFPPIFWLAMIYLAITVSLPFGYGVEQFGVGGFTFSAGIFPVWFILILAPLFEEFGWRTYGTHCIRRRFNLFQTCIIFGVLWIIWHIPLSFIYDYHHSNVAQMGIIHSISLNFSFVLFLITDHWIYYKTKRNMLIQFMFHLSANFSMQIFRAHPHTEIIHTLLLFTFCVVLVIKERKFFFEKTFEGEVTS